MKSITYALGADAGAARRLEIQDSQFAAISERLLDRLNVQPSDHVVELGVGAGSFSRRIVQRLGADGSLTAVDYSQGLLDQAEQNLAGLSSRPGRVRPFRYPASRPAGRERRRGRRQDRVAPPALPGSAAGQAPPRVAAGLRLGFIEPEFRVPIAQLAVLEAEGRSELAPLRRWAEGISRYYQRCGLAPCICATLASTLEMAGYRRVENEWFECPTDAIAIENMLLYYQEIREKYETLDIIELAGNRSRPAIISGAFHRELAAFLGHVLRDLRSLNHIRKGNCFMDLSCRRPMRGLLVVWRLLAVLALFSNAARGADAVSGLTATATAPVYPVLIRNEHGPLLRVEIEVDGNRSASTTAFSFSLNGTDDLGDLDSLALFSAGDKLDFSTGKPFGSQAKPARQIAFRGNQPLLPGKNVFWLSCRLKDKADLSHDVVATCTLIETTAGKLVPSDESPGVRHRIGVALRRHGDDGVHTYRIPSLTTTPKGTLLCVYDMRRRMGRDLQEDIDIGLSRSTDGGRTWASPQVIMDMGEYGGLPQEQNGCSDPGIIVDRQTGEIFCFAVWMNGKPGKHQWRADGIRAGLRNRQECADADGSLSGRRPHLDETGEHDSQAEEGSLVAHRPGAPTRASAWTTARWSCPCKGATRRACRSPR